MKRLRHPVRAIREPFGTAGLIVALVALVAALGGTALAAKGALTGKQKKEVEKIAKKYAGKPGAPGATGPAGAAGAAGKNGTDGTNGTNGSNGADGKSVEVTEIHTGEPDCAELGGAMVTPEEGEGVEVCNGAEGSEGSPWTHLGVLPSGQSEKGAWGASIGAAEYTPAPISFNIPLAEAMENAHIAPNANCPGTLAEPEAAAGNFCLYVASNKSGISEIAVGPPGGGEGVGTTGAIVSVEGTSGGYAFGTWAVTAP